MKKTKHPTPLINPNPRFCDLEFGARFYLSNPKFNSPDLMEKGRNERGAVVVIHLPTGFVAEVLAFQYFNLVGVWPV